MLEAVSAKDIAVSALRAQRVRMNVIATNIANVATTRTAQGGPFRRQLALFRGEQIKAGHNSENLGVRVSKIIGDPAPFPKVYQPEHPDADGSGYVSYPNVNVSIEMIDLISAQRAYDANISVLVNDRRMVQKALEIIQR